MTFLSYQDELKQIWRENVAARKSAVLKGEEVEVSDSIDVILYDDDKRNEEIRKAIKDIIASSFDIRQFEKEQVRNSKKCDWQSLEYR